MTQIERLQHRLLERGTTGFHIEWGPDAHTLTPEERAGVINDLLDSIDRGEYSEMQCLPRSYPKTNVKDWIESIAGRDAK